MAKPPRSGMCQVNLSTGNTRVVEELPRGGEATQPPPAYSGAPAHVHAATVRQQQSSTLTSRRFLIKTFAMQDQQLVAAGQLTSVISPSYPGSLGAPGAPRFAHIDPNGVRLPYTPVKWPAKSILLAHATATSSPA